MHETKICDAKDKNVVNQLSFHKWQRRNVCCLLCWTIVQFNMLLIFIIPGVLNEHSIQLKWWPVQYVGSTGLNMGPRRADVIFVRVNTQRWSDGNKYSRKTHASARLMSFHWISPSFILWIYHWRFQTMADHKIGSSFIKSTIQCDIIQCEYILSLEIFVNIWSLSSGWPKISTSLSGDVI